MNSPRTRNRAVAGTYARVSNASASSSAPTKSHEWRNLPQPSRDPETSGPKEKASKTDRNLPTAPPDRPQREAA